MSQVSVTIAGRTYRMACAEGEEEHLRALARQVDARVEELKGAFGEIGDQRLTVMAALTFADDLHESRRRADTLAEEVKALGRDRGDEAGERDRRAGTLAEALEAAAARLERLAQDLSAEARA